MVQLEDNIYLKLKKDADDNNSVRRIVRYVLIALAMIVLYMTIGMPLIDIQLRKFEAQSNVEIRRIESYGLTTEEYLKWYDISTRNK